MSNSQNHSETVQQLEPKPVFVDRSCAKHGAYQAK
jgi:hypothetical protein